MPGFLSLVNTMLLRQIYTRTACTANRCRHHYPRQTYQQHSLHHNFTSTIRKLKLTRRYKCSNSSGSSSPGPAVEGNGMREIVGFGLAGAAASFTGQCVLLPSNLFHYYAITIIHPFANCRFLRSLICRTPHPSLCEL